MSDDGLRALALRVCRWCGTPLRCLSRQRVTCSERCRVRLAYHRRYPEAARLVGADRQQLPIRPELSRKATARIERQLAAWETYHRATRRYRIADGWDGYHVRYEP